MSDEPTVEDFDIIVALALTVAAYRIRAWWWQLRNPKVEEQQQ